MTAAVLMLVAQIATFGHQHADVDESQAEIACEFCLQASSLEDSLPAGDSSHIEVSLVANQAVVTTGSAFSEIQASNARAPPYNNV